MTKETNVPKVNVKSIMVLFQDTSDQLILFTKLFVIMGPPWLSVCIHILIHGDHTQNEHCSLYIEVRFLAAHLRLQPFLTLCCLFK